jgi:hypothetical protein
LDGWGFDQIDEIADSWLNPRRSGLDAIISGIPLLELLKKGPAAKLKAVDSVPVSRISCRTFLLMKKEMEFEVWDTHGVVLQKAGNYLTRTEVKSSEIFDSVFTEHFYAFVRKNEYYFVTESGKLYHAPPPKEAETKRTMKALWTDAKQPIVAVIEDADRDKVWLFAKGKDADAKRDLYFELKSTIQTESFDPAKLRRVNVEGRAKLLLEYLPLIRDAK